MIYREIEKLLTGPGMTWKEFLGSKKLRRAIGKKWDPEVMKEAKQFILDLIQKTDSKAGRRHALAILPLLGLKEGEEIEFEGRQKIHIISLTPSWMGSPIEAYLLEPIGILLFKPTPFPACEGHYLALLADVNPWMTVGKTLFLLSKKKLQKTLTHPVEVVGLSLGGALTLHFAEHLPHLVKKAWAFNPPAFLWPPKKSEAFSRLEIIHHPRDWVFPFGFFWPKQAKHTFIKDRYPIRSRFLAHLRPSSVHPEVVKKPKSYLRLPLNLAAFAVTPFLFVTLVLPRLLYLLYKK